VVCFHLRSAGPARRFAACQAGAAFLCCRRDEKNKVAETQLEGHSKSKLAKINMMMKNRAVLMGCMAAFLLGGCATEHPLSPADLEMTRTVQLVTASFAATNEQNPGMKLGIICSAFYNSRNRWPQSVDDLRTFWGFATPELYADMWGRFQGAVLVVKEDGSLRLNSADGKITLTVEKLKAQ
jgi:hypothetical protein